MRLWSASEWTVEQRAPPPAKAPPIARRSRAASRPSETLGTASSVDSARDAAARRRSDSRRRRRRASARARRSRGGRAPGRCRRSPPRRRRRRGRCRGSSRPRARCRSGSPLRWCRSRARRRWSPSLAVRRQQLEQRARRSGRSRSARWPPRTVSAIGVVEQADAGDRAVDDERALAAPSTGAMKPSPQGRLPKAPRRSRFAGVDDRRCGRSRSSRRSLPCGQVIWASSAAVEQLARRRALRARSALEVDGHHAREHVGGDAGQRGAAGAGVASPPCARAVCESDWVVGRQEDVGGGQRRGDRWRAARRRRSRARPSARARRRRRPPRPRRGAPGRAPRSRGRSPPRAPRPRAPPGSRG